MLGITLPFFAAVDINGNASIQLAQTTTITCSTPVPVQSIKWLDESNAVVRNETAVQELILNITAYSSLNNTIFTCTVSDGRGFMESKQVSIYVECTFNIATFYLAYWLRAMSHSSCNNCPDWWVWHYTRRLSLFTYLHNHCAPVTNAHSAISVVQQL